MDFSPITSIAVVPIPVVTPKEGRKQPGLELADVDKTETAGFNNRRVGSLGTTNESGNLKENTSPSSDEGIEKEASESTSANNRNNLSPEQQKEVESLKRRDREVKAHEAAHLAVAGQYARGGINLSYSRGPDGNLYAVSGEVGIDSGPVQGDPEATIRKAQQVRAAALAPAQPSATDRAVAASASQLAATARAELAAENSEDTLSTGADTGLDIEVESSNPISGSANEQTQRYSAIEESEDTEQFSSINIVA